MTTKKKIATLALLAALAAPSAAWADEDENSCTHDDIQRAPNPLVEVVTLPFKAIAALTFGVRCMAQSIPKNPPQE